MGRLSAWVRAFADSVQAMALTLGAPGLFVVGFLDSSFLSLPEINDLLVVWMVTRHKSRAWLYVLAATGGSIAGCLVLYFIGRRGGHSAIARRFSSGAVEKAIAAIQRHGMLAVLVPSLLPPPAPFKIFVLLAGVAGISVPRFVTAVAIGRGLRYSVEGVLAIYYGDRAIEFIHENGRVVSIALAGVLAAGFVGYLLWRRGQKEPGSSV